MKNFILFAFSAALTLSFTSCLKGYDCQCPSGTTLKVSTTDEVTAKSMCEEQSNGRCTL